ncbi:MAG: LacI family DNA-binding transcriptional regulator [Acidobacteriaceae bacterium]
MSKLKIPGGEQPSTQEREFRQTKLIDVARYLKLSTSTVSRVVNQTPSSRAIPAETQDRILRAAQELNYQPNMIARSLRQQKSYSIGIIVPEIGEGYSSLLLSSIERSLVREGYFFFVVSHMHRMNLLQEYTDMLAARGVAGIIAVDTPWRQPTRLPVVTISGHQKIPGVTNITINHNAAAVLALGHLRKLGHQNIAVIKGQFFSSDSSTRWKTIQQTAKGLRLHLDPDLVVPMKSEESTSEPGYIAMQEILRSGKPFSAVFAFNDISAIGAIRAIREAGLSVPEDVSVVGFDDVPSAAFQHPALTTIRQPLRIMGDQAVKHLLQRINAKSVEAWSDEIVVEPELIVRGSTAPCKNP